MNLVKKKKGYVKVQHKVYIRTNIITYHHFFCIKERSQHCVMHRSSRAIFFLMLVAFK